MKPTPKSAAQKSRTLAYIALIVVDFIAAGTFLVAKQTTTRFTPMELGWFRITLSFILIIPLFLFKNRGKAKPIPKGRDLLILMVMGLAGVTANQLLFLHGIHLAPPIDGALLYSFTPVVVLIGARLFLGESLTWGKAAGIAAAIFGVYLVLRTRGLDLSTAYLRGDLIMTMAVVAWAVYTLLGKQLMKRYDAMTANLWAFGFGALSLLPAAPWILGNFNWSGPGIGGWTGLVYLSLMTSVISFTLWTWALKSLDAVQVAIFANLQPPLTALLAWLIFSEIPTWEVVVGGTLVIVGVTLAQLRYSKVKA